IQGGYVAVARDLAVVSAITDRLMVLLTAIGLAVIALSAGGAFILVRRSLRPLAEVEAAAGAIAAGDLSRRVPQSDPRTEVGQMSAALNSMLGRLEDAFEARAEALADSRESEARMRAFVADASHELRTPLTAVSGYAELYRQGAVPAADVAPTFARIERESERMSGLVDDLLLLARLDQQRPLERRPVDLLALATADVGAARASHPDRQVTVTALAGDTAPEVIGDEDRLAQVIRNLTTNALRYSDGPVSVQVGADGDVVTIRVVDHGPGIPQADKQAIFERFYRGDAARSRESGGTGLGLSIVAAIVAAHQGSVAVTDTPGGGASVTVTLPTRPA
ncbi:MAG: Histidine kinase, partial [Actinomycetota bacterium]|nr:Histidine kinase [Actinomycetota bacterium]